MKKIFKQTIVVTALLTLAASSSPTISVLADESNSNDNTTVQIVPKKMSEQEKQLLVQEVKRSYPTVSETFIREALQKQLNGDYSIPQDNQMMSRSAWQGITVDQMGALIDVGLGTLLGAGVGGIAGAIARVGKHEAKTQLKKILAKYGLMGGIITDKVLDYALNLTSPGYHIAKYWDNHDKYPGNGRINFEW